MSLSICAQSEPQSKFGNEGTVIVAGKIINFGDKLNSQMIEVIDRNIINRDSRYSAIIFADGSFKIEFPSAFTHEIYIIYGEPISIICSPGDSLFLKIDQSSLKEDGNGFVNGKYFVSFPETEIGKTNEQISRFLNGLPNEKYTYQNAIDPVADKSPEEYSSFIGQRQKEYQNYLKEFLENNKTTQHFEEYAKDRLKYESWNDLMRYCWYHPVLKKMKQDSLKLPGGYFSFLKEYDMDDDHLFTLAHTGFLHEFSNYASANPKDSLKKVVTLYQNKQTEQARELRKTMIRMNSTGFTRDLFFTKEYLLSLKSQDLEAFDAVFDSTFTKNSYFLRVVKKGREDLVAYLSHTNTKGSNIASLSSSITDKIIEEIANQYKGKVLYIDFWAPWCSPCMAEMVPSKVIQEHFKGQDVIFLFLACQCKEASWKSTIANKKMTGEHILLTDDQYKFLATKLGISGIPHYTLVDKSGKIIMKDATRPSAKDELIGRIENLLK